VTIFTRGKTPNPWGKAVTALIGIRDPRLPPRLDALRDGAWDAVIDTSGYLPRCVSASAALLADRVQRYLFVSSVSVYGDLSQPGIDETGQLAFLLDPNDEDIGKSYGPLKVACEQAVGRHWVAARSSCARAHCRAARSDGSVRVLGRSFRRARNAG